MTRDLLQTELQAVETGELLLPLLGSLVLTGVVAAMLCQPPAHSWPITVLFGQAAVYLLFTGLGHALAVWLVRRLFDDGVPWPTEVLVVGLWSTVVWLPLLSLLTARDSLWVAATLPFMVNCATRFLRRSSLKRADVVAGESSLFLPAQGLPFWRTLMPAALSSASLESGVVALFLNHPWLAGSLFASSVWLPVWRLVEAPEGALRKTQTASVRKALGTSFAAWLLTAVALVPFASGGLLAEALRGLHLGSSTSGHRSLPHKAAPDSKGRLQFVVLLQPPRPRTKQIDSPAEGPVQAANGAAPVVIPFDGPYWFFKHTGDAPTATARRERGDPRKVNIRSTDGLPILMEAHQAFEPPLRTGAARTLQVEVVNADDRPGVIALEVIVKTKEGDKSLGALPLKSTTEGEVSLGRPPVQEILSFSLPAAVRSEPLQGITVRFKPDATRALAAPLVAVQSFTLRP